MAADTPIVLVTYDFPPISGGIARFLADMCRWLPGSRLTVVAPEVTGGSEADRAAGYRVVRVAVPPGESEAARLRQVMVLRHWMDRHLPADARVVFGHFWTGLMTLIPRWRWKYAVIFYGGELPRYSRGRLARRAFSRVATGSAACLAISRYAAAESRAWGIPDSHLRVFMPGLDLTRLPAVATLPWEREKRDGPVLLTVARLEERKGHVRVIEALPRLRAQFPGLRYRVVGSGPRLDALQRRSADLRVSDIVDFLGFVPDAALAGVYEGADMFVMPSLTSERSTEGFGIVFLEANFFGLPVVGYRSGGVPDAVVDGETGLLVSAGETRELEEALSLLAGDRELRFRLGRRGRERVLRDFDWQKRAMEMVEAVDGM